MAKVKLETIHFLFIKDYIYYIMNSIEALTKTVNHLKYHIDCLLIRVSSCEEFIEKILKAVQDNSMGGKTQSMKDIVHFEINSPSKGNARNEYRHLNEEATSQPEVESPSLKDFILFPNSK